MPQLMASFRGRSAPDWVLDGVRRGEIGALCLFAHNVVSPAQLRELAMSLHDAAHAGGQPAPLVGIDQEGGQLMAVTGGATELPGNMALGATRSTALAERTGRLLGTELLAMGCNMDFAPVLDLAQQPSNPVVGIRSFGDEPTRAAELGAAMIRGMQDVGIVATAKHFPGHGNTVVDSHHGTPQIRRTLAELDAEELVPFRAAIDAGVGAIMSAHATYPHLDHVPATISRHLLTTLLREALGFDGLIVTDAMDMSAVAHLSPHRRVAAALAAGADLVLLGHLESQSELIGSLQGRLVGSSVARIDSVRHSLPRQWPTTSEVGCAAHRALAQEIADAAVTAVRDHGLPLRPDPQAAIAVVTVNAGDLTPADTSSSAQVRFADQIAFRHPRTQAIELRHGASHADIAAALATTRNAECVIFGSIDAHNDPSQIAFLDGLRTRSQHTVLVALRTPFDLSAAPWVQTYLCAYGIREPNTEAAARILFGEISARGSLPCAIEIPSGKRTRDTLGERRA